VCMYMYVCMCMYVSAIFGRSRVPNARFDRSFSTWEVRVLSQFRAGLTSFLKAVVDGEREREKREGDDENAKGDYRERDWEFVVTQI